MPEFLARHPRLRLHTDLSDQFRDLTRDGFDLAVRIGSLPDSSLVAKRLAPNRRLLCASPDYLKRRGEPATPEDLAHHDCLVMATGREPPGIWRLARRGGKEVAVRVRGRLESNLG